MKKAVIRYFFVAALVLNALIGTAELSSGGNDMDLNNIIHTSLKADAQKFAYGDAVKVTVNVKNISDTLQMINFHATAFAYLKLNKLHWLEVYFEDWSKPIYVQEHLDRSHTLSEAISQIRETVELAAGETYSQSYIWNTDESNFGWWRKVLGLTKGMYTIRLNLNLDKQYEKNTAGFDSLDRPSVKILIQ